MSFEIEAAKAWSEIRFKNDTNVCELTDEKILKMAADTFHYSEYKLVIKFVRDILKEVRAK